jgi:hypothetical protein
VAGAIESEARGIDGGAQSDRVCSIEWRFFAACAAAVERGDADPS